MASATSRRKAESTAAAALVAALCLWGAAAAMGATAVHLVSQRGRAFQPGDLTIHRGDSLEIVNDDGDLIHHAYIDTDDFSFDSGDQAPGSKVTVVFTKSGVFTVLCGIHPKMKMNVTVLD